MARHQGLRTLFLTPAEKETSDSKDALPRETPEGVWGKLTESPRAEPPTMRVQSSRMGKEDSMTRRQLTPEQIIRKLEVGD